MTPWYAPGPTADDFIVGCFYLVVGCVLFVVLGLLLGAFLALPGWIAFPALAVGYILLLKPWQR